MGKKRTGGDPDKPRLDTIDHCMEEISECTYKERSLQSELDAWKAVHPQGDAPGLEISMGYWRERRSRADTRLKELIAQGQPI